MANRSDLSTRIRAVLDADQPRGAARAPHVTAAIVAALILAISIAPLRAIHGPQSSVPATNRLRFEVASVKVNVSGALGANMSTSPGGRFTARNVPLRVLIQRAYQLQKFQLEFFGPAPGGAAAKFRGVTLEALARFLSMRVGRPVIDRTGLTGFFDADLEMTAELGPPPPPPGVPDRFDRSSAPSIFTVLQERLGLKLEARKGSIAVFVIDHLDHPAQTAAAAADAGLAFEVATIKSNDSGSNGRRFGFLATGSKRRTGH